MKRARAVHAAFVPFAAAMVALLVGGAAPADAATKTAKASSKPAAAKEACYSRAEHAAEQVVRLHTELMIIGLTCQSLVPDRAPFSKYQEFTVKNRAFISQSEAALVGYFQKTARGNSTRMFDMYRTEMANEISRRASIIGNQNYCAQLLDRAQAALTLTLDDLRTLTADEKNAGLMHLSSKPLCDVQVVSRPDAVAPTAVAVNPPRAATASAKAKTPAKAAAPAKAPAKAPPAKGKTGSQTVAANYKN